MTRDNDTTDDFPALVSVNEASRLTSLSRTSIFKLSSLGKFPKAVPLGEKRLAFVRSELIAWIEDRIAEREAMSGEGGE